MNASPAVIGYLTILRKETVRVFRIWTQTILPSVVTQSLYFLIFGSFIGSQIGHVAGMSYVAFLVPGLILMSVITNAFSNTASSFFGAKFMRSIDELLVSPLKPFTMLAGYVSGGIIRGVAVGAAVFIVSLFFAPGGVQHPFILLFFLVLTALIFSALGFLNGMFARKFDDVGIVPTFVLTPLTYLGGVFYRLEDLPAFWQAVSRANPIVYMIDGFRFGFFGVASTPVLISAIVLLLVAAALIGVNLRLLRRGVGLKV